MKNTKGIGRVKTKMRNILSGGNVPSKEKSISTEPEEYEEERSPNIRMKPQPFQLLPKPDKKKIKSRTR